MTKYLSTAQVAEQLGVSPKTVQRAANRHGIGHRVGDHPNSPLMFTLTDLKKLKSRIVGKRGNPGFYKGSEYASEAGKVGGKIGGPIGGKVSKRGPAKKDGEIREEKADEKSGENAES